ncbi:LOW QUALITY PROTEIN: long-chain-fatty-acid--CoA ligase ACSBG2-like [Babylonia areolata]|uniref:LOW QUALITY PROTEIN: long-chain-fatty-acid--CoA ligase ACSBG2-like n=1 Tax=Babylonia areolata TaxID=304850 RepID=UPI003FD02FBF
MSVAFGEKTGISVTSITIKKIDNDFSQNSSVSNETKTATPVETAVMHRSAAPVTQTSQQTSGTDTRSQAEEAALNRRHIDDPVPSDVMWTTKRDGAVKLRTSGNGVSAEKPITVVTLVKNTVSRLPNGIAMAVKREGQWVKWTYSQYMADIRKAAKSFIKLGLEPYKGVGIVGFNSPEWFLADLGCIFAGGLATGIYTTNSPEACQYVADSCQANVIVVENNQQLQKILKVRGQLPHLKAIVQYTGDVAVRDENIYSWAEFMEKGRDVPDQVLEERMKALAPNKCCLLIYTSGTTGTPKGVMLSHDNITYTAHATKTACARYLSLAFGELAMVSYLPLSHIAAQMLDIYVLIAFGGTAYFAQPDALKGSLATTLREVRPHVILGVPRVWEKMQETMQNASRRASGFKRKMGKWAKGVGYKANYALMNGGDPPMGFGLADKLVFKKVRAALGLDRCQIRLSGAAPITKDTLDYFLSFNLPLCEVYGMSECTGPHSAGFPLMNKVGSVGRELPGNTTTLANTDADGNGEIVMHGRHVFMGYINEEEKTQEVFDDEGGLHSGDVGRKDKDDFLFITGRIKELIITAGGENIPPVAIEDAVKEALPVISQCMLIGDKKKFLSMLLTLKVEVNPDTQEPSDRLSPAALDWMRSVGSGARTVGEVLEPGDQEALNAIQKGINSVNSRATSNAQKIQKWSILPNDFSIPGGELGPTMKMRRPIIVKKYHKTINAFYEEAKPASAN